MFTASPRSAATENYFYTRLPEAKIVEGWLAFLDENFAGVYQRIERKDDVANQTPEDRGWVDILLALMTIRTRATRERVKATAEESPIGGRRNWG